MLLEEVRVKCQHTDCVVNMAIMSEVFSEDLLYRIIAAYFLLIFYNLEVKGKKMLAIRLLNLSLSLKSWEHLITLLLKNNIKLQAL